MGAGGTGYDMTEEQEKECRLFMNSLQFDPMRDGIRLGLKEKANEVFLPNRGTYIFREENVYHLFEHHGHEWVSSFDVMKEAIEKGGMYLFEVQSKDAVQSIEGGSGACWVDSFEELLQRSSTVNL
jgi:hypothetical protein